MARKRKKVLKEGFSNFIKCLVFIGLSALVFWYAHNNFYVIRKKFYSIKDSIKKVNGDFYTKAKIAYQQEQYEKCVKNPLPEEGFNEQTSSKKQEILDYSKKNGLKYKYEDLKLGYSFSYAENDSLYGASLIKLVDALYLIDNDVDLSKKIKYESKYVRGSSEGMSKHSLGSYITLEDLMKYAITYSDNTAHAMLYEYIGKSNLKNYANNLGATTIFTGTGDTFGNQTVHDTAIYLKRAYEVVDEKPNGKILKEAMLNTRKNKLNFDDITYAHKYGSWEQYFHNIGIHYGDYPYTVSVLTTKGENNAPAYINKLSKLSYEFNKLYYENLLTYCDIESKKD